MIKENVLFLKEFFVEFRNTGSFYPTSKWAAQALTWPIAGNCKPKKILEIGPGTGSVTVQILKQMQPNDELMIVEINPRFLQALKKKLSENIDYQENKDRVHFFEGPIQSLPESSHYDIITCALPFLNFNVDTVKEIFEKLKRLSHSETVMSFYEYIGLRSVNLMIPIPARQQRMKEVHSFLSSVLERQLIDHTQVWLNVLPINVYTLKFAA